MTWMRLAALLSRLSRSHCRTPSCGHLVDQRRVVIARAGLIEAPRHRPHAKAILSGRIEKLDADGTVEPGPDICFVEYNGHPIVNRSGHRIGVRDDDRARVHEVAGV